MECYTRTIDCSSTKKPSGEQVEISIELGHEAVKRISVSEEGFTHDWRVFVKGVNGRKLDVVISKVVFHLHDTFSHPKRVVTQAPYEVSESGYGSFTMQVEIFLRTTSKPRKLKFNYDLYLGLKTTTSHSRVENMIFQNPSVTFYKRLCMAAGQTCNVEDETCRREVSSDKTELIAKKVALKSHVISDSINNNESKNNNNVSIKGNVKSTFNKITKKHITKTNPLNKPPHTPVHHIKNINIESASSTTHVTARDDSSFEHYLLGRPQLLSTPYEVIKIARHDKVLEDLRIKPKESFNNTISTLLPQLVEDAIAGEERRLRTELLDDLQEKLSTLNDRVSVKKVVKIVKSTGHLKVLDNTYDFNLQALDNATLLLIRHQLE